MTLGFGLRESIAAVAAAMLLCAGCDAADHVNRGAPSEKIPATAGAPVSSPAPQPISTSPISLAPSPVSPKVPRRPDRSSRTPLSPSPTERKGSTAVEPSPSVVGPSKPASAAKVSESYKLFTNDDGTVVRWNPCRPIHYALNVSRAADPVGARSDVQQAVARVASATGLTFVYDGPTTLVPTKAWLDAGGGTSSDLLIAWAPSGSGAGKSDLFGSDADGEGGWWESGTSTDGTRWVWQIKRGFVVIDPSGAADYVPGFGTGETRGVLLMHELGHAVGLGHTGDRREVMFPVITPSSRAAWGPGDLDALALVGKVSGCIS